jgi:excinuclease UvrABC nuclease subunit
MNNWSNDIRYISANSSLITQSAGVYLVLKNDGVAGQLTNVYVGRADNLNVRYTQHLADSEANQCLKDNIRNNECYFRYLILGTEQDRSNKESELLRSFSWQCNQKME